MSTDNRYSWIDPDEEITPYLEEEEKGRDHAADEDTSAGQGTVSSEENVDPEAEQGREPKPAAQTQEDVARQTFEGEGRESSLRPLRQVEAPWTRSQKAADSGGDDEYGDDEDTEAEDYDPDYDILAPGQPLDQPPYNVPFQPGDASQANPPGKRPDRPLTAPGEAPKHAEPLGDTSPPEARPRREIQPPPPGGGTVEPGESVQPAAPEGAPPPVDPPASQSVGDQAPGIGDAEPTHQSGRPWPMPYGFAPESFGVPRRSPATQPEPSFPLERKPRDEPDQKPEEPQPPEAEEPTAEAQPAVPEPKPAEAQVEKDMDKEEDHPMRTNFDEDAPAITQEPAALPIPAPEGRTPEEKLNILAEWLLENLAISQVFVIDVEGHTVAAREVTRPVLSAGSQLFAAWAYLAETTGAQCGQFLRAQLKGESHELALVSSGGDYTRGTLGLGILCQEDIPRSTLYQLQEVFADVCKEITSS